MWWAEALASMLALCLPERAPPTPRRTSQATEAEEEADEAAKAALAFSLRAASSSPKKFARGGSVSEKEREASASDFAAEEDVGKGDARRLERLE